MFKVIVVGIIITVITLATLSVVDSKSGNSTIINGQQTSFVEEGDNVSKVTISGEINHPGDYTIATDKTLGDLIYLAGGITSKADEKAYNSSILIASRTEFYIAPVYEIPSSCVTSEIKKVNINSATNEELIDVGFNSSQASSIISYRKENGQFEAIEDLLNVKGIGKSTYAKVKTKITIY